MIAGVWRVRHGELLDVDLDALVLAHQRIAEALVAA